MPVSVPEKWRVGLVIALLTLSACGRQAPPLPPIIRVAERTSDLSAFQKGEEAVLRWSYPSMTTAGESLTEIEAIEVWRAALPLAQEPPPPVSVEDRRMRRQLLEAQGEVVVVLVPDQLSSATRGPDLYFRDDLRLFKESIGETTSGMVLWYGVRTICCRGRESDLSNVVRLEPQEPPRPPTDLLLTALSTGIEISWHQDAGLKTLVERSSEGATWSLVSGEAMEGLDWRDTTASQGRSWSYRLRSVRELPGGGRVVGQPSEPSRVSHPDTYPPRSPAEIVCLPEGATVRVRWRAAPGSITYRVIRRGADDVELLLSDQVEAVEFTDPSPPLGPITYLVVAVDDSGNASGSSSCSVVMGAVP